jgi:hypothetical protein
MTQSLLLVFLLEESIHSFNPYSVNGHDLSLNKISNVSLVTTPKYKPILGMLLYNVQKCINKSLTYFEDLLAHTYSGSYVSTLL